MKQSHLRIVPLTTAMANRVVAKWHRHHGACPAGLVHFCIGVVNDVSELAGVAMVGRPANRNSDDGLTAEVLRVATNGTANACSALYGAAGRVAAQMGFGRIITYTLEDETGVSLRGAGWTLEADGIRSMWASNPEKNVKDGRIVIARPHYDQSKVRWSRPLPLAEAWTMPADLVEPMSGQGALV